MIDFRYHLVSIIAVFMALAVGIVLGSGPLKEGIDTGIQSEVHRLTKENRDQRQTIQTQQKVVGYSSDVANALAPSLLGTKLLGRRVVVLTLPGADSGITNDIETRLKDARATVTATVALTDSWTDPTTSTQLDDVITRVVPALPTGITFPPGSTTAQRAAIVLAASLVTRDPAVTGKPDAQAKAALGALSELGALKVSGGDAARRATLAVIVAPAAPTTITSETKTTTSDQVAVANALAAQDLGTVVAGPLESADTGGLVAVTRADGFAATHVSTVDSAQLPMGRVSAVLALAAQLTGTTGAYGYGNGADSALPATATDGP